MVNALLLLNTVLTLVMVAAILLNVWTIHRTRKAERRAADQVIKAQGMVKRANDARDTIAANSLRAGATLDATYRALLKEQNRLQCRETELRIERPLSTDILVVAHRAEGVTSAINILTDEARRRGHVIA